MKRRVGRIVIGAAALVSVLLATGGPADAVPTTRLRIEGSTYDAAKGTWALGDAEILGAEGSALSPQAALGPEVTWEALLLGDGGCSFGPGCSSDRSITGYSWTHFDAFHTGRWRDRWRDVFGPFSHEAGTTTAPEPPTVLLLGLGLLGLGWWRKRRTRA